MARRCLLLLAPAACLALAAAACGGDAEAPGPQPATGAGPAERRAQSAPRDRHGGRPRTTARQEAEPKRETNEAEPERGPEQREGARRRKDTRAELKRALERARATVRTVVGMISAGNPAVCRRFFTQRYAELVSGLEGDAALGKCRRDIERSKGSVELTAFGPARIEGDTAYVKFNVRAAGRLAAEEMRLVYVDRRWLVDGKP